MRGIAVKNFSAGKIISEMLEIKKGRVFKKRGPFQIFLFNFYMTPRIITYIRNRDWISTRYFRILWSGLLIRWRAVQGSPPAGVTYAFIKTELHYFDSITQFIRHHFNDITFDANGYQGVSV